MVAYHIKVHGRVQGVFFRKHTRDKAHELGITGTVRNCPDGTVEISAEGSAEKIKIFIRWCHTGPEKAKVDRLDIHEQPLKNFLAFIISY